MPQDIATVSWLNLMMYVLALTGGSFWTMERVRR